MPKPSKISSSAEASNIIEQKLQQDFLGRHNWTIMNRRVQSNNFLIVLCRLFEPSVNSAQNGSRIIP